MEMIFSAIDFHKLPEFRVIDGHRHALTWSNCGILNVATADQLQSTNRIISI